MKSGCVVVFPLYRKPNKTELAFLQHGLDTLNAFDCVIAGPESLDTTDGFGTLSALKVIRFKDDYFKSINGYNQLLLSAEFYQAFNDYDYLLIHQADVYVFKNELNYWCDKGYAYIGAPWFRPEDLLLKKGFNVIRKLFDKNYGKKHNQVGNGGFSLRNIHMALAVLSAVPDKLISKYRAADHHKLNEDVFWSFEAPKINTRFRIPDYKEALRFGVEFNPEAAIKEMGGQLPFGCHAPLVYGKEFWSKYISFEG